MTKTELPGPAVTASWLAGSQGRPGLVVLDGSWYLPTSERDARGEFLERHIPGARFFDVDGCSDPDSDLPHTLPTPERFSAFVEALGITNDDAVVVYDASGVNLSAPRVWWTFRYFGHDRVAVLDGGLDAWIREGLPTESGEAFRTLEAPEPFRVRERRELLRSAEQVLASARSGSAQIVDVRSAGRFAGSEPEPRPGLRGGHIPGSRNLPYGELVDPATGMGLSEESLRARLGEAGVKPEAEIIGTCGSGTSACALAWSLARIGKDDVAIYDGSWAEWGGRDDLPISTGPPDADG